MALGILLTSLCVDVLWLGLLADVSMSTALHGTVVTGSLVVAMALPPMQLMLLVCTVASVLLKLLLLPVLIKAYSSVRLPVALMRALQEKSVAQWRSSCTLIIMCNFTIAFGVSIWRPSPTLVVSAFGCWAVSHATPRSSMLGFAIVAAAVCTPVDILWLFTHQARGEAAVHTPACDHRVTIV